MLKWLFEVFVCIWNNWGIFVFVCIKCFYNCAYVFVLECGCGSGLVVFGLIALNWVFSGNWVLRVRIFFLLDQRKSRLITN